MTAKIIDGLSLAKKIQANILKESIKIYQKTGQRPCLNVFLVGDNPASMTYVKNKKMACEHVQIDCQIHHLPLHTTEEELLSLLHQQQNQKQVHGILVQLPLPQHISSDKIMDAIAPFKDVDGFHPYNLGLLCQNRAHLRPCTPKGIMHLLDNYAIDIRGKNAVCIGISQIVGRPMGMELLNRKASVTYCHRDTIDLGYYVKHADLIIAATGQYNIIPTEYLKSHQVIIDVGIHKDENNRLRGDIDFSAAKEKVAYITPVPGGVGPMTIAALLENMILASQQQLNL